MRLFLLVWGWVSLLVMVFVLSGSYSRYSHKLCSPLSHLIPSRHLFSPLQHVSHPFPLKNHRVHSHPSTSPLPPPSDEVPATTISHPPNNGVPPTHRAPALIPCRAPPVNGCFPAPSVVMSEFHGECNCFGGSGAGTVVCLLFLACSLFLSAAFSLPLSLFFFPQPAFELVAEFGFFFPEDCCS